MLLVCGMYIFIDFNEYLHLNAYSVPVCTIVLYVMCIKMSNILLQFTCLIQHGDLGPKEGRHHNQALNVEYFTGALNVEFLFHRRVRLLDEVGVGNDAVL